MEKIFWKKIQNVLKDKYKIFCSFVWKFYLIQQIYSDWNLLYILNIMIIHLSLYIYTYNHAQIYSHISTYKRHFYSRSL